MPSDTDAARKVLDYIRSHWDASVRRSPAKDNIVPIPIPYTAPCIDGKFVALFYWDTYWTNLGLIGQGRADLAKSNCDALLWFVEQKGFVPNSNFRDCDNRSQPPYLSPMVRDVYETTGDKAWLARASATLQREYAFWMTQRVTPAGLNRHGNHATDAYLLERFSRALVRRLGKDPSLPNAEKIEIARHYLSEAETGWDFNPRFGGRCLDFCPADLNASLWLYEMNFAWFARELGKPAEAPPWQTKAEKRRALIDRLLWDDAGGLYRDYDHVHQRPGAVASMATFLPLWSGLASPEQARRVRDNLARFEREFGVAACEPVPSDATYYQWGYPNGWPPLFHLCFEGLRRYGFDDDARRIARKYADLIIRHFQQSGQLWEKFDVVTGGLAGGEYEAQPMLGWSAGVFVKACEVLGIK